MSAELFFVGGIEHKPITASGDKRLTLVTVSPYFTRVIEEDVIWYITSFVSMCTVVFLLPLSGPMH